MLYKTKILNTEYVLNMYLKFGRGYIQKVFPEIKNLAKYK